MESVAVAIIGSGPSGYTAGIYAARANLQPVMFAGQTSGGQLMLTTNVENWPGAKDSIMGPDLMMAMRAQAERFGTKMINDFVTAVDFSTKPYKIWSNWPEGMKIDDLGNMTPEELQAEMVKVKEAEPSHQAEAVIVSTGAVAILLGVPGESQLMGRGVSTCAVCDAAFYKDKNTYVIGGGDAAMEEAMALTKFASSVTIIHRRDQFKASKIMAQRVLANPKVKVIWNSTLQAIKGEQKVEQIVVATTDPKTNQTTEQELPADGVFIAIGHKPMSQVFIGQLEMDSHGYIITRQTPTAKGVEAAQRSLDQNGLVSFPTMTSVEGVFAAGDVVDIRYKQAVTAAGQGCQAALDAERWLEALRA